MMRVKTVATVETVPAANYAGSVGLFSRDQVLTVPNLITLVRLACLPWFVALMADDRPVAAAFVLGSLGATDWVDGWLARRLGQTSELGAILDPTADRLVFFVGLGTCIVLDGVPAWFGIAILVREVFIAAMMVGATLAGMERFPVTRNGKIATFALLWAVPWILVGQGGGVWVVFQVIGWCLGVPGLVLSYVTAARYVPLVRAHLRSGRLR